MTCVGTEQLRTGNIRREDMGEKIKNMFRGHKEKKKNQNAFQMLAVRSCFFLTVVKELQDWHGICLRHLKSK